MVRFAIGRRISRTLFRQDWEEDALPKFLYSVLASLAGDERNVGAGDAEIGQFAVRQTVQLADGVTFTAPVAIIADDVHLFVPCLLRSFVSDRPLK